MIDDVQSPGRSVLDGIARTRRRDLK